MSKPKQPGLDGRHRDSAGQIRQKRSDTLTLGLGAFQKISAVEGIRVGDPMLADLRAMAQKHPGENARTRYITGKYGKK